MNNRCFGRQIQAETADLGASLIRTLELLPQVIVDAEALAGAIEGGRDYVVLVGGPCGPARQAFESGEGR